MVSARQNVLIETHALRQQAGELLAWLEHAHEQLVSQLKTEQREDMVRVVAGRSSLEAAIEQTRRMIDAMDRAMAEVRESGGGDEACAEAMRGTVQVVGRLGAMFGQPGGLAGLVGSAR